jgi:hypothetical protein
VERRHAGYLVHVIRTTPGVVVLPGMTLSGEDGFDV